VRYGVIVQWFPAKKFGFIAPDRGPDIFFHISAIGGCQPTFVELGQPVKYELLEGTEPKRPPRRSRLDGPAPVVEEKKESPVAKLVEFIDRIPGAILDTVDDSARVSHHPKARRKKPNWRR
jgi:cold shock CspA family protein